MPSLCQAMRGRWNFVQRWETRARSAIAVLPVVGRDVDPFAPADGRRLAIANRLRRGRRKLRSQFFVRDSVRAPQGSIEFRHAQTRRHAA